NAKAGEEFLAENGKRAEVRTTPSGLQYEVIKEGDGPQPAADDQVVVHYTGKLIDGTVFDSSEDRGMPATFGVTQVIPGWVEALQLMKAGSTWRLFIPSALAYGPQGAGNVIGPNATLIFDVTLIEVVKK
ncbi:MAG: FKBP-type peptidyl-prolyl cis-trans isomerase, partial [Muribaculaceae bacterium]|nr:FKBP-type peptidyl-prolyl cis-trans isomerase [Muribaculaceae bacterium]